MVAYSFKQRFVQPIRVGLSRISLSFDCPPKRQTIRAIGKRRHARPGETLQLYFAQRSPQCEKIGDARCISVQEIRLVFGRTQEVRIAPGCPDFELMRSRERLDEFATGDGFDDWDDMHEFWKREHGGKRLGPFVGMLIRWEPLP